MIYTATVSSKGQITLPAELRRQLNLHAGSKVNIEARDNTLVFQVEQPISAYRGILKGYNLSADDIEIPKEKDPY